MLQALRHLSEVFACDPTPVQEQLLELIVVEEPHGLGETRLAAVAQRILLQAERHVLNLLQDWHQNITILQALFV